MKKNASFNEAYHVPKYFPKETYELMLNHELKADSIFRMAIELEPGERHDQLLDLALAHKIDFASISLPSNISPTDLEKCFSNGLKPEHLVKSILNECRKAYDLEDTEYTNAYLTEKQLELLNIAIDKGINFNKVFEEFLESTSSMEVNGIMKPLIIPEKILEMLVKEHSLNPSLILEYAVNNKLVELARFALINNADPNFSTEKDYNLIVTALLRKNIEMVDFLIEHGTKVEISLVYYVAILKVLDFNYATQIIKKFPDLYNDDQLYEVFRAHGSSEVETKSFIDLHDLMKEYLATKADQVTSLSLKELDILEGKVSLDNINEYKETQLTNKYGYSALHLSLIGNQYALATKMISNGFDVYAKSHNNITSLQLIPEDDASPELVKAILEVIDNVDIEFGSGETLADTLIQNKSIEDKVIELSNDPLFFAFKKNINLFDLFKDSSKTYVAISHGDDFWSTGVWSTARLIVKNYPNVTFYLVNDNLLKQGGEAFLKQFDGIINPGSGDTYPKLDEFKKADCPFNMGLEKHYQNMLELSYKHDIPYLGMCAGAQHFSMYHEGSLAPLEGYGQGQHIINYIDGTLPYFMALTKEQQKNALNNCEFAKISFKGDTAHHYAAMVSKLGNGMQLGAISEDGVAMSYAYENGIRYATQFHPENYYDGLDNDNTINQKAWINNYVEMAIMHHEHKDNGKMHPLEHYATVKAKLQECTINPTCVTENSLDVYKELFLYNDDIA